jgi:hypothetical protein
MATAARTPRLVHFVHMQLGVSHVSALVRESGRSFRVRQRAVALVCV